MVLYNLNLDLDDKYVDAIRDIFKFCLVLIVFHILMYFSKNKKYGIIGNIFNENFANTLVLVMISFASYHLVINEIIQIN